jgi:hypothetical protein
MVVRTAWARFARRDPELPRCGNPTLMAQSFTNRWRADGVLGLSCATCPGDLSLPTAQAADADGHARYKCRF